MDNVAKSGGAPAPTDKYTATTATATATATATEVPVSNIGERPEAFKSTFQEMLFVLTATMAIGMSSMLVGAVTVITSRVQKDLNMTTAQVTWISGAASLASGSFLLFFGRVADLFGRKSLFIGSMGLFPVFALAAGFAQTPMQLDVIAGIMGLTSAAVVPPAQGMLGVIYDKPSKRKNRAFACFSAGNPLGFVFGSIFSGIASQLFDWRASFWLLAIIYVLFTAIAVISMPVDHAEKLPLTLQSWKRFDLVGTGLTIAGIGMFSSALSLGSDAPQGWKTPYVLVLLILGIVLIVGFVFWEQYVENPLVPMGIWKDRDFSLLISILLLGFLACPIASFWLSLYMQNIHHYSALMVAVHLLPMVIGGIIVNIIAGLIMHLVSNKLLMLIGSCSFALSALLLSLQSTDSSYWAFTFPALLLAVVGADLEFNVTNMYVMSALEKGQQSMSGGIYQTVTKLCVTIGLGLSTAIFDAVQKEPARSGFNAGDPVAPYAATWYYCAAVSAVAVPLVPFLRIGTQGHRKVEVR
ncbi:putative transporter [Saccharata proteae CBS 121410]|uniref:Transporter n=1 Tax=Saccharata proteae CBS 121410 TaxID=1314787 RepID=A0A9P4LSC0_9PEZI|nr:putative transporter [Saccharata proteae CBS 121410]